MPAAKFKGYAGAVNTTRITSVKNEAELQKLVEAIPIAQACLARVRLAASSLDYKIMSDGRGSKFVEPITRWVDRSGLDMLLPTLVVDALRFGFAPLEIIWGVGYDGSIEPYALQPIHPSTVKEIKSVDGQPVKLIQQMTATSSNTLTKGSTVELDWNVLASITYPYNPSYPQGWSIFWPLAINMLTIKALYELLPNAAERAYLGTIDITFDPVKVEAKSREEFVRKISDLSTQISSQGGSVIRHEPNIQIDYKSLDAKIADLSALLNTQERTVARAFNALGLFENKGVVFSDKAAESQEFRSWVKGLVDTACLELNKNIIDKYLLLNGIYPGACWLSAEWPESAQSEPADTIAKLAGPIATLVDKKLIVPTYELAVAIAQAGRLPVPSEDEFDAVTQTQTQPAFTRLEMTSDRTDILSLVKHNRVEKRFTQSDSAFIAIIRDWFKRTKEVTWKKLRIACNDKSSSDILSWSPALAGIDTAMNAVAEVAYREAFLDAKKEANIDYTLDIDNQKLSLLKNQIKQELEYSLLTTVNKRISQDILRLFNAEAVSEATFKGVIDTDLDEILAKWETQVLAFTAWAESAGRQDLLNNSDIVGFVWDTWIDETTTEGCKWAAGRYLPKTSPWYGRLVPGFVHFNCRSVAIPVPAKKAAIMQLKDEFTSIPNYVKKSWNLIAW